MNIEKVKKVAEKAEVKFLQINRLLKQRDSVLKTIQDLKELKKHAGTMLFTGKSGKIGDESILFEIYVNGIGGCVEVPRLIMELAEKKLKHIEDELLNIEE